MLEAKLNQIGAGSSWSHVTIFYTQDRWSFCLIHFLKSAFHQMKQNGAKGYILAFDNHRGDALKISLKIPDESKDRMLSHFHDDVTSFLAAYPSDRPEQERRFGLLMDFPNNSVLYGLHRFSSLKCDAQISACLYLLHESLSDRLIDLATEEIDDETLFSVFLYVQIILLRSYSNNVSSQLDLLKLAYQEENFDLSEGKKTSIRNAIERDKESLTFIFEDVEAVLANKCAPALSWLLKWRMAVEKTLTEVMRLITPNEYVNFSAFVYRRISDQLGIYKQNAARSSFFLIELLSSGYTLRNVTL